MSTSVRHLVGLAGVGILVVGGLACMFGGGSPELGACEDYLACAESIGQPTAVLVATYGEDGQCWDEEDEALCQAQCADALTVLADTHPNDPVCGAGDTDTVEGPPPCADELVATGSDLGDVVEDFTTEDSEREAVRLYDRCDHAVVVMVSTDWDGAGRASIPYLNDLQDQFAGEELEVLALIDAEDYVALQSYADDTGAEVPVWLDPDGEFRNRYEQDGGVPSFYLLAPGMVLEMKDEGRPTVDDIEAVLP